MADETIKVMQFDPVTDATGGWIYIVINNIDYRISFENLMATINGNKNILFSNKSNNFSQVIPANTKIARIDFIRISGTPVIKVGTTAGNNDVISENTLTAQDNILGNGIELICDVGKTLYFSISGGAVSGNIIVDKNYLPV